VLRVLSEPTASALAYGAGADVKKRVAVYDLGGGTFDVTVLKVEGYVFEALATGGDAFLGGDDIDAAVTGLLAISYLQQHGADPRGDPGLRARLALAAEQIKIRLSERDEARGDLKNLGLDAAGHPIGLRFDVTRTMLETAVSPLVARTFKACADVLTAARMKPVDLDEVILVGGSTRIPLVRRSVERFFGRPPRADIHPDDVVAHGAAFQADMLADQSDRRPARPVLLDVTPRALGIAVAGGFTEKIVDRNVAVPTEKTRVFVTSADNQTAVRIQICQGESRRFAENAPLGELELTDLPRAPRGEVKIEVTFRVDADGILRAQARDTVSGRASEAAVNVSVHVRGTMSEREIAEAIARHTLEKRGLDLPRLPE
jgi:molecular chaperone DnaK